jgi:hypothetical protein
VRQRFQHGQRQRRAEIRDAEVHARLAERGRIRGGLGRVPGIDDVAGQQDPRRVTAEVRAVPVGVGEDSLAAVLQVPAGAWQWLAALVASAVTWSCGPVRPSADAVEPWRPAD